MRKLVTAIMLSITGMVAGQQVESKDFLGSNPTSSISELLERSDYYGLTTKQTNAIEEKKAAYVRTAAALSADRTMTADVKSSKKAAAVSGLQQDVEALLTDAQRGLWASEILQTKINKSAQKSMDYKLELLALAYETDVKQLEHKYQDDTERLAKEKEQLKAAYLKENEVLKKQKEKLK